MHYLIDLEKEISAIVRNKRQRDSLKLLKYSGEKEIDKVRAMLNSKVVWNAD